MTPFACADIVGNASNPNLKGIARFYGSRETGVFMEVEVTGLPDRKLPSQSGFFGIHIHENADCTKPFDKTGVHYNPKELPHPYHAGDLPSLLSNQGYAYLYVYTNRLQPDQIMNRSVVVHSRPDDYRSQPAGDSGDKIGCGVIKRCR